MRGFRPDYKRMLRNLKPGQAILFCVWGDPAEPSTRFLIFRQLLDDPDAFDGWTGYANLRIHLADVKILRRVDTLFVGNRTVRRLNNYIEG